MFQHKLLFSWDRFSTEQSVDELVTQKQKKQGLVKSDLLLRPNKNLLLKTSSLPPSVARHSSTGSQSCPLWLRTITRRESGLSPRARGEFFLTQQGTSDKVGGDPHWGIRVSSNKYSHGPPARPKSRSSSTWDTRRKNKGGPPHPLRGQYSLSTGANSTTVCPYDPATPQPPLEYQKTGPGRLLPPRVML